jgi:hypothetical protein
VKLVHLVGFIIKNQTYLLKKIVTVLDCGLAGWWQRAVF